MSLPEKMKRREDRLAAIAAAKAKIETRAQARFEQQQAAHEAKKAARADKQSRTGKKPPGRTPRPPDPAPRPEDPANLTGEDSRIMKLAGGGFEQCCNAQVVLDTESMLVMAAPVSNAPNDRGQLAPMIAQLQALPPGLDAPEAILLDSGCFSDANVGHCEAAKITPFMATGREGHHRPWAERFTEPAPLAPEATPAQGMRHRLATKAGRARYALRKQTVEPVFGIIKSVLGFRQFLMRGLDQVQIEWTLVCLAWNLKRMALLRP